jgi:Flp pilus assembly protein TadG
MRLFLKPRSRCRRGVITVLAAILIVVMLGIIALAVDMGYLLLVRGQLQTAADSAALAAAASTSLSRDEMESAAKTFAAYQQAGGRAVQLKSADIQYGSWDSNARTFASSEGVGNAVRVTARMDETTGGGAPMFFARVFNLTSMNQSASAVATVNPRDIAFVIDVSGSMNDDTDPANTDSLDTEFAAQGYPNVGTNVMQNLYTDFGYGAFPGTTQCMGAPLGITTAGGDTLSQLSSATGKLSQASIPDPYHIYPTDTSTTRQTKAYKWTMDVQIPQVMPAAKPTPNSATNYNYWKTYLSSYYSKIGYRSYTTFMMKYGRETKPDSATYTPLSQFSNDCPWHMESTAGGTFSFPPREMPTHAARRAMIAAIQLIKERNQSISDANQQDWVSVISYDTNSGHAPTILVSLTSDYDSAMQGCTRLQAYNDLAACTATETGLMTANSHIKPTSEGGHGRLSTNKIVVLLTDGKPNLYTSSSTTISNYISQHPSSNFYTGGSNNSYDAALMQASIMQRSNWYVYPVGIGLDCDYGFMDRMGRMGTTADKNGASPRGSGNPGEYEAVLTGIFQKIITNPKLRLVQ